MYTQLVFSNQFVSYASLILSFNDRSDSSFYGLGNMINILGFNDGLEENEQGLHYQKSYLYVVFKDFSEIVLKFGASKIC